VITGGSKHALNGKGQTMKKWLVVLLCSAMVASSSLSFAMDVYVTSKGKKYHTADCRWVQDRDVKKLGDADAVKAGYAPCSCIEKMSEKQAEVPKKK